MGVSAPRRGEVHLISLDPTQLGEIKKTRPCLIVSPDELNDHLGTFIVAPMTTGGHSYPFRIACRFKKRDGYVVLDQLRTVDGSRVVRRLGRMRSATLETVLAALREMFEE